MQSPTKGFPPKVDVMFTVPGPHHVEEEERQEVTKRTQLDAKPYHAEGSSKKLYECTFSDTYN